jgi:osmotically-inducible protein OsmY
LVANGNLKNGFALLAPKRSSGMSETAVTLENRVGNVIHGIPHLLGRDLRVTASEGTIVLSGEVGSYYQKQVAQEAVWTVEGVDRVVNELRVPRRAK